MTNENKEPIKKEKTNTYSTHVKMSKKVTEKPTLSANEITKHNRAKESKGKCTNLFLIIAYLYLLYLQINHRKISLC